MSPVFGSRSPPLIALVVPCFNEEAALPVTIPAILASLTKFSTAGLCASDSFMILVDDGSSDATWQIISSFQRQYPNNIAAIRLAVNAGHQYALIAGLDYAAEHCEASVSIDADMQHDINIIPEMLSRYRGGDEIVLGIKRHRESDSLAKRWTASMFYRVMRVLGVTIEAQHADFRLMSSAAMKNLRLFPEYHLFLRGFPHLLHQRVSRVEYDIAPRNGGESKYSLRRMFSLAWNGITSFSVVPLRAISVIGLVVFLISVALAVGSIVARVEGTAVPGWASITVPLYGLGGMIMLSIGIVGEYVGKIFIEVKRRPRYIVDTLIAENVGIPSALTKDDEFAQGK